MSRRSNFHESLDSSSRLKSSSRLNSANPNSEITNYANSTLAKWYCLILFTSERVPPAETDCAAFACALIRTSSLDALCAMNANRCGAIQPCPRNSLRVSIPTRHRAPIAADPFGKTPRTGRTSKKYACSGGTTKSKSLVPRPTQTHRRSPSLNESGLNESVGCLPKRESN